MRLTDEQFAAMQPYENHFRTAVKASWSRNPGMSALDLIHDTYVKVTGDKVPLNKGCSHCVLRLLTDMGMIYLADLEERNRTKVVVKESLAAEPVKVEVKTRKPRKPKK